MEDITFTLPHPCLMSLCGPTAAGKSTVAFEIIRRRKELFAEPIEKVTYVYTEYQPKFSELEASDRNIRFTKDLNEIDQIKSGPHLVILDDLQQELTTDKKMRELVTQFFLRKSHHRGISCCLLLQNPFAKNLRDINLNSQVMLIWDYARDRSVMSHIAKQICPGQTKFLQQAYEDAVTRSEFGYLVLIFHPRLKKYKYWVRSSLFPSSDTVVYAE